MTDHGNDGAVTADLDGVLRALSHPVRRAIVTELASAPDGVGFDGLREVVASRTPDDGRDTGAIRTDLHHRHLPVLTDAGLGTVDREDRLVRPGRLGAVGSMLDGLADEVRPASAERHRLEPDPPDS